MALRQTIDSPTVPSMRERIQQDTERYALEQRVTSYQWLLSHPRTIFSVCVERTARIVTKREKSRHLSA